MVDTDMVETDMDMDMVDKDMVDMDMVDMDMVDMDMVDMNMVNVDMVDVDMLDIDMVDMDMVDMDMVDMNQGSGSRIHLSPPPPKPRNLSHRWIQRQCLPSLSPIVYSRTFLAQFDLVLTKFITVFAKCISL